jgi:hypothetical protein
MAKWRNHHECRTRSVDCYPLVVVALQILALHLVEIENNHSVDILKPTVTYQLVT